AHEEIGTVGLDCVERHAHPGVALHAVRRHQWSAQDVTGAAENVGEVENAARVAIDARPHAPFTFAMRTKAAHHAHEVAHVQSAVVVDVAHGWLAGDAQPGRD